MGIILGIDAGGTKTEFTTYNEEGQVLHDIKLNAGNIIVDEQHTLETLQIGVRKILSLERQKCDEIVAGIAGIETSGNQKVVEKELGKYSPKVTVISDAKLGLFNKLKGREGVLLISGTGSVAYGLKNGKFYRVGGWGHIIGDEGSAYSIAIKMYKKLAKDIDYEGEISAFSRAFINYLGYKSPKDALKSVYNMNKGEVAKAAKFLNYVDMDVQFKISLIDEVTDDLSKLVKGIVTKMSVERCSLALAGSVLEKNRDIREKLSEKLNGIVGSIILNDESNTKGAFYFHKR